MAIGLSFVSGIIFPFMCNGHRADIRQVVLSGNSWMANASSVVQDTKTNKSTIKSSKPSKKKQPKPSGILRNAMIVYGSEEFNPKNKTDNADSRDWGIVPRNLFAVNDVARRIALEPASGDILADRIDKLRLGLFLKRGDVFFVFNSERVIYQVTRLFTTPASHPDLPADLSFGHAGVITHFAGNCADVYQFTKCVYVTEQGLHGLEFRTLHQALSGQSQVLILRPIYGENMANKLADSAMDWLDKGLNYDWGGAIGATTASVGRATPEDPNAFKKQQVFCSQFVMMLLAEAKVLREHVEMCLPPSLLADMLLSDIPPEQRELWGKEGLLSGLRGVAPSEVVFYQQCAKKAEGEQLKPKFTYWSGWRKRDRRNEKRPWRVSGYKWVESPAAVPGVMGLLTTERRKSIAF